MTAKTPSVVRRAIAAYLAATAGVALVLSLGVFAVTDAIVRDDLRTDAEQSALLLHHTSLRAVAASSSGDAVALLRGALEPALDAGTIARVKVWERVEPSTLRIVYSDLPELIGDEKALRADRRVLFDSSESLVLPLPDDAAHRTEAALGDHVVEVFTAVDAGDRQFLIETYHSAIDAARIDHLRTQIFLLVVVGMIALALATLPLALVLARRTSRAERERGLLISRASAERERERRALGRRLHDGALQDLAGAALALDTPAPPTSRVAAVVRGAIADLRSLLDDLVASDVEWATLDRSLAASVSDIHPEPIDTEIVYSLHGSADSSTAALVARLGRELILNAVRHAGARRIIVAARVDGDVAELTVSDDGTGFDTDAAAPDGHFGLRIVDQATRSAGGSFTIESGSTGTRATIRLPADLSRARPPS